MSELAESELTEIARAAALRVPGLGTVERVKVDERLDSSDEPAYYFSFLVGQGYDPESGGVARIRLGQNLRDALMAREDGHYPYITLLTRADWEKREGA
nr:hypothetical protein [uncultured Rhodopila sp.]